MHLSAVLVGLSDHPEYRNAFLQSLCSRLERERLEPSLRNFFKRIASGSAESNPLVEEGIAMLIEHDFISTYKSAKLMPLVLPPKNLPSKSIKDWIFGVDQEIVSKFDNSKNDRNAFLRTLTDHLKTKGYKPMKVLCRIVGKERLLKEKAMLFSKGSNPVTIDSLPFLKDVPVNLSVRMENQKILVTQDCEMTLVRKIPQEIELRGGEFLFLSPDTQLIIHEVTPHRLKVNIHSKGIKNFHEITCDSYVGSNIISSYDSQNTIELPDRELSNPHLKFEQVRQTWIAMDTDSRTGVWMKMPVGMEFCANNDTFKIETVQLRFKVQD